MAATFLPRGGSILLWGEGNFRVVGSIFGTQRLKWQRLPEPPGDADSKIFRIDARTGAKTLLVQYLRAEPSLPTLTGPRSSIM